MDLHALELLSWDLRQNALDVIMAGGGGHIGGDKFKSLLHNGGKSLVKSGYKAIIL